MRCSGSYAYAGVGALVLIGACVAWSAHCFNELVAAAERADDAWAQVGAVLQRRSDLIPNLVAVTAAHAEHERQLIGDLTAARTAYTTARVPAERVAGAHQLNAAIAAALVAAERYPHLGSTRAYANLHHEVVGSDNRIAIEQARYNAAVRDYNITLRRFPSRLLARASGFDAPVEYSPHTSPDHE